MPKSPDPLRSPTTPITHVGRLARKQSLLTHAEPATANIADATIIKDEDIYFVANGDGSVPLHNQDGFGLYFHDCRYLDGYTVTLGGERPLSLVANASAGFMAVLELTNPDLQQRGQTLHRQSIGIKWERIIEARRHALHDSFTFENFTTKPVTMPFELNFSSSFEDVFVVRGLIPKNVGKLHQPRWSEGGLLFHYDGSDAVERFLHIHFFPRPRQHTRNGARFMLQLQPHRPVPLNLTLAIAEIPRDGRNSHHPPPRAAANIGRISTQLHAHTENWLGRHTSVTSDYELLQKAVHRSLVDLGMLRSRLEHEHYFSAGLPWFGTLFGRDSIITALATLEYEPALAEQTLRLLARLQGKRVDNWRDEQPGKILHELRVGELARTGEIPHTPYYGTVDATPLFLILLVEDAHWRGSLKLFNELRANVEAALSWIDNYGDHDGDGYVEYASSSRKGLVNQGWKDSGDGIVDERGRIAQPPIALVEVQGYVYRAKLGLAELFERAGNAPRARELRQQARALRRKFNRDFWVARLGTYALCLERHKRRAAVVASNAGQALWCGIPEVTKARSVSKRLLQPDMFSGWGVRTLSSDDLSYNPVGYHLGTVWPHDNAIIAAGFRRYGFDDAALRIFGGILDAATNFMNERLPEVFAGFDREHYRVPVNYPVACHPQAWAAASLLYLLQTSLGIVADGFNRRLRVVRPVLPEPVQRVEVRGIAIAGGSADLEFRREHNRVRARVLREENVSVVIEPNGTFD